MSSFVSVDVATSKGSTLWHLPKTVNVSAVISTIPVAILGLIVSSSLLTTSPLTVTVHSLFTSVSILSSCTTTCTTPYWSRTSKNITPPWSRIFSTQPATLTLLPICDSLSSPHKCVRYIFELFIFIFLSNSIFIHLKIITLSNAFFNICHRFFYLFCPFNLPVFIV